MLKHITVLKSESIEGLNIKPDGIYVDATLGGAGHSQAILSKLTSGKLFCFDKDKFAIEKAREVLGDNNKYHIINSSFVNLTEELKKLGVEKIDGILFDLGLSSFQIDDASRGFSYLEDARLDMRMDKEQTLSAYDVVNNMTVDELTKIFRNYGEEKNAYYIAREIIKNRPVETTADLVKITDKINFKVKGHSAKRVFQALRIYVNNEMDELENTLRQAIKLLNIGGRIAVISFHSLEDRIVKQIFKEFSEFDIPKNLVLLDMPTPPLKIINRKVILPSNEEIENNSRSRSAKLRIGEKANEV